MADGKVKIRIEGDTVHFNNKVDEVEGRVGKMSGLFAGLGGAIGGAVSQGVGSAVAVMGASIDKAADFNETLGKTSVLFGEDMVAGLEDWAASGAQNFGQSKQTALDAAATFAVFGKAAGLAGEDLAGFAKKNVELASDLASFHNTKPEDAIFAIGAAMRGEAEPMRAYGVLLDAASIKAKAVQMGLVQSSVDMGVLSKKQETAEKSLRKYNEAVEKHGKDSLEAADAERDLTQAQADLEKTMEGTVGELDNQAKTLAANQLIMEQTVDAQGDFARTSDGMANSQRAANAEWENMQIQIGEKLLPVKMALVGFIMNQLLPALAAIGSVIQTVAGFIVQYREYFIVLAAAIVAVMVPALLGWITAQWALVSAQLAGAAAVIAANAPIILITAAIAALVAGIIWAYQNWDWFRAAVHAVKDALVVAYNWISNNVIPVIGSLIRVIADIATTTWDVVSKIVGFFAGLATGIAGVIGGVADAIEAPFKAAFNSIAWLWNNTVGRLSFSIPGWVPGMGGKGFDVPDIPTFAEGGLAFRPTLAIVGDHKSGGAEIITPEQKMREIIRQEGGGGLQIGSISVTGGNRELVRELDLWWRTKR